VAIIRVLSAGAAQAVIEKIATAYTRETGNGVKGEFNAVGAIKQRVLDGDPVDVVVLTGAFIDELVGSGHVTPGSRADLGRVGTGVAVRFGTPLPDVSSRRTLRGNLLAATKLVIPDPAIATAGKVVMRALGELGVIRQVQPKTQFFSNGYTAMQWLAESRGLLEMGMTQITEILAYPGVTYAGPLPDDLQMKTVYSAGLASQASEAGAAREFIARLTGESARPVLEKAGYEFD
jgi:molybdate transport system substrate-binding protein